MNTRPHAVSADLFPYYSLTEVELRSPFSEVTRMRLEKQGCFPRRIRFGKQRVFWRKAEVDSWLADPERWRPASAGAVA